MSTSRLLRPATVLLVLVSACLLLLPRTASAGSVSLTLTSTNLTMAENGTITLNFDLSNTSGAAILLNFSAELCGPGSCGNGPIIGDTSDFVSSALFLPSSCLTVTSLSDGSSCAYSIELFGTGDKGETDNDFSLNPESFSAFYDCPPGTIGQCLQVNNLFTLKVTDSSAPEPASLLLLGTGLLGLGPFLRSRFMRA